MFTKLYRLLLLIKNRDYIPPLPRGMLATEYDEMSVTPDEWRVLDRIGARDPIGIKRAMKKYNVDTIPDLVALLDHHKPKRKFWQRLDNAIGRVVGGYKHDPHAKEVKQVFKLHHNPDYVKIKERVRRSKQTYDR